MPLPSGTTISAADINSHLGRTSGTAVDWNTIVRTLSNNNSTPNLGDARGRSARHLQATINYSSDVASDYNYNAAFFSTAAYNIPGTPWRVIATTYPASATLLAVISLTIVGTHHDTKYTYTWTNTGLSNHLGSINGQSAYFGTSQSYAMLDNGKFVIFGPVGTAYGNPTNDRGIGFLVITFGTDGQINSCNSYVSRLSNAYDLNAVCPPDYNLASPYPIKTTISKYGNKFVAAILRSSGGVLVHVDLSSSTPVLKYAIISSNSDLSTTTGWASFSFYKAVYKDDNNVYVYRVPGPNGVPSSGIMVCKTDPTASTLSWTVPNPNRWGPNTSSMTIETGGASPYTTYTYTWGASSVAATSIYLDKRNYLYRIDGFVTDVSGGQISPTRYMTGTISAITIQKIDPSNSTVSRFAIGGQDVYWSEAYSDKSGSGYYYYSHSMISNQSVKAIESDASGNTYVLYKTGHHGVGAYIATSPQYVTSLNTAPLTQQVLYHISKYNSSGVFQWNKVIDLGSRTALKCPYLDNSRFTLDSLITNGSDSWNIITRDDIGILEIYCQVGISNSSNTLSWTTNTATKNLRSAHLLMSTGDNITQTTGYVNRLSVYSDITSTGSSISQSQITTTTTATLTFPMHSRNAVSDNNGTADSSVFSNSSGWWTESLSVGNITSSPFALNATTVTLGYSATTTNDQ